MTVGKVREYYRRTKSGKKIFVKEHSRRSKGAKKDVVQDATEKAKPKSTLKQKDMTGAEWLKLREEARKAQLPKKVAEQIGSYDSWEAAWAKYDPNFRAKLQENMKKAGVTSLESTANPYKTGINYTRPNQSKSQKKSGGLFDWMKKAFK